MDITRQSEEKIYQGDRLTKAETLALISAPLEEVCMAANRIRMHFCGKRFDLCTIINGKSGRCSENCKYCAQSAHYDTRIEEYPLLDTDTLVKQAEKSASQGVLRYSIVTSRSEEHTSELQSH